VANPYTNWNQIDPDLPDREILVYGPPTTSGTRDAFEELALEVVTEEMEGYDGAYTKIRTDGPFVPAGENDNLIVQRLAQDADALGIFGYSFLEENLDKVEAVTIEGVAPTSDSISSGEYPLSRSLYFYVKNAHVGVIPGMKEFLDLFMSEKMIGRRGYLRTLGLVPLPEDMRAASRKRVEELSPITRIDDELTDIHAYMEGKE
jgi:phosphate transport system substrate-binding protein